MPTLARFRKLGLALDPGARRMRADLRRVSSYLQPAERVLDLGSGTAPYAPLFAHRNYVTADLFADSDVRCDAAALPFADKAFDLVLCTEVLEHVPNPDATLHEIRRTMRANGALVLTTPLTWGVHAPQDYHRWTESGLRQLLARHEFKVVELRPRGGVLLCFGALLLILPWQLFGEAHQRKAWQSALFAALYTVLTPFALVLAALDPLDHRQHFTFGYVALCRPA
jgi:SAM-dependent methyltransferase